MKPERLKPKDLLSVSHPHSVSLSLTVNVTVVVSITHNSLS